MNVVAECCRYDVHGCNHDVGHWLLVAIQMVILAAVIAVQR